IDPPTWEFAPYAPTPSIVEATQRLFGHHTVRNLSHAYADNLGGTVDAIAAAIREAQERRTRVVCIVTGVPGAGKTLAGLAAVHDPSVSHEPSASAAFLSGNGPLVRVLREAIIRDAAPRLGGRQAATRQAELLVQNVHAFLEEYGVKRPELPPHEHVIVFDEA